MFNQQNKTGFGSAGFGSTNTNLFGNKTTTSGGLFGSSGGSAFGTTSASGGFSGFGSTNNTPGTIFGTPATKPASNLFGTPSSQGFGSTGNSAFGSSFGQNKPSGGGLFGSTPATVANSFASGGIFGANTGGFSQQVANGTGGVKFAPITGSDIMMKNGVQQNVQTRHQCITAMKEYDSKSFEELRTDDYLAGRKGPSGGTSAFGTTSSAGSTGFSFGQQQSSSNSLFGSNAAKPAFGASTGGSIFGGNTNTSTSGSTGLFGSSNKPFGAATTSTGFGFGTQSSSAGSLFGVNKPQSGGLFGNTTTSTSGGGLFGGASSSAAPFGSTGFGSGGSNLFGSKPGGFGTTTTASSGFGTNFSGFGNSTSKPSTGLFGGSTGFGQTNAGNSVFGGGNKPAFGATNTSGGLFGSSNLGASTQNKGGLFGGFGTGGTGFGGTSTGFNFGSNNNALGSTNFSSGFGQTSTGLSGMFGQQSSVPGSSAPGNLKLPSAATQQSAEIIQALLTAPFGDSPLFKNRLTDPAQLKQLMKPTNLVAQKVAVQSPIYRVSPTPTSKIKPKARLNNAFGLTSSQAKPHQLFAGLDVDEEESICNRSFVPRTSVKKLTIKVNPNRDSDLMATPRDGSANSSRRGSLSPNHMGKVDERNAERERSPSQPIVDTPIVRKLAAPSLSSPDAAPPARENSFNDTLAALNVPGPSSKSEVNVPLTQATKRNIDVVDDGTDRSEDDTGSEVGITQATSHPAGIKLSKDGYFTSPTLEQLAEKTSSGGKCKVNNFTIGRKGYGSVVFEEEVDLTGLDLDKIVHIRRREVTIYPDDSTKPSLGQGLNKRAEITLDGVWPMDKSTREPVTEPGRLAAMGWVQKLKNTTLKMDAHFCEFRIDTGSWVFKVDHFSKYGLPESDDEDQTEVKLPFMVKSASASVHVAEQPATKRPLWSSRVSEGGKENKISLESGEAARADEVSYKGGDLLDDDDVAPTERNDDGFLKAFPQKRRPNLLQQYRPHRAVTEMESEKLQQMKASLFADDAEEEDRVLADLSHSASMNQIVKRGAMVTSKPSAAPTPADNRPSAGKTEVFSPLVAPISMTKKRGKNRTPGGRVPIIVPPVRKPLIVNEAQRFVEPRAQCDVSLMLGRSFRVGWGPGWAFVHSGNRITENETAADFDDAIHPEINIQRDSRFNIFSPKRSRKSQCNNNFKLQFQTLCVSPRDSTSETSSFVDASSSVPCLPFLECALRHSDVAPRSSLADDVGSDVTMSQPIGARATNTESGKSDAPMLPLVMPSSGCEIVAEYVEIAREARYAQHRGSSDADVAHTRYQAFGLCNALWGRKKLDECSDATSDVPSSNAYQAARKSAVISWLVGAIETDFDSGYRAMSPVESTDLQEILDRMTEGKIQAAVEVALKTGNARLALLLSQAVGNTAMRVSIAKQLTEWEEAGGDSHVSDPLMKIYALLASKPMWLSGRGLINTCEGLDWKRSLLLHLVFISDPSSPISDGVELYRKAWKGTSEFAVYSAPPVPHYKESSKPGNQLRSDECSKSNVRDVLYHLLRLYCRRSHRMEKTLAASSSVSRALDQRVSWHMWRALVAVGYRHCVKPRPLYNLHVSYGAQLEACGMWHQAIFVLMHIVDDREREMRVKELICRHVTHSQCQKDRETFIVDQLGVPKAWLDESRALDALAAGNYVTLARQLLLAGHWRAGHDVVMHHVTSEAFINGEQMIPINLLSMIEAQERWQLVPDWSIAGKLYLDHFSLLKRVKELQEGDLSANEVEVALEEIKPEVTSLCRRVVDIRCRNACDRLARAEMAKQAMNLHRSIFDLERQHEQSVDVAHTISATLPCPVTLEMAVQTARMRLPEEYALQGLRELAGDHFRACMAPDTCDAVLE